MIAFFAVQSTVALTVWLLPDEIFLVREVGVEPTNCLCAQQSGSRWRPRGGSNSPHWRDKPAVSPDAYVGEDLGPE